MKNRLFAGLGLGLVAAVVFASATTGPMPVRLLLFFITPLPIFLAGLGWTWQTAVLAGLSGSGLVALVAGPVVALLFAASQVIPAVVLVYLALLSRPVDPGAVTGGPAPAVEWYPPGRLVIWAAVMSGALTLVTLLLIGGDLDQLRKALGEFLDATVKSTLPSTPSGAPLDEDELKSLTDVTMALLPAATAISWMASLVFNLWLGGRITFASGQLARPWPDLAAIEYPTGTSLAFGAALLATLADGYVGLAATGFAGAFFLAYVLLGLAIIHYTTRGFTWRPFALWALYGALLLVNIWFAVLVAILGLLETVLALRARAPASGRPPPI